MNQLKEMMQKLKPVLHEIDVNGAVLYVHSPKLSDAKHLAEDPIKNVLLYCVSDKNGNPVFSTDASDENKIHVDDISSAFAEQIFKAVLDATQPSESTHDNVEK